MIDIVLSSIAILVSLVLVGVIVVLFMRLSDVKTELDKVTKEKATIQDHTHKTVPSHTHPGLGARSLFDLTEFAKMDADLRKALIDNISNGVLAKSFEAMAQVLSENKTEKEQVILDLRKLNESINKDELYKEMKQSLEQEKKNRASRITSTSTSTSSTSTNAGMITATGTFQPAATPSPIVLKEGFIDYQRLSSDLINKVKRRM